MKMKLIYLLIASSLLNLMSCKKDFLDIVPKGQMIPQTTADYRKILDFVGNKNNVGHKTAILVTYGIVNLLADDYQVGDSSDYKSMITTDRAYWYHWGKEGGYPADQEDPDWRALYGQIYIMNSALNGIPNATGPQTEKDELMAEAKFHRAFCFLGLVNIYSKHYTPASAATEMGVPLRLTVSLTESLERASIQETYDQIIKDLTEAIPHLEVDQGIYNHRPTSSAAHALLARTYLYMGNYEKALEHAEKSLGITDFLYDLNVALNRDTAADNFNSFDPMPRSWDDKEILIQKETTYDRRMYRYSYMPASPQTVNALYDTTNDLRFRNYFALNSGGTSYEFTGTIKRWDDAYYYPQVGLTVPEMYLTRAEANARLNNLANAINDLNLLRSKRYITGSYTPYNVNDYNQGQIIQMVKDERRRELWGRGVRWFDLKRYNALDGANITIERQFTGGTLMPGDDGWVVPIAQLYINQNPEIKQN